MTKMAHDMILAYLVSVLCCSIRLALRLSLRYNCVPFQMTSSVIMTLDWWSKCVIIINNLSQKNTCFLLASPSLRVTLVTLKLMSPATKSWAIMVIDTVEVLSSIVAPSSAAASATTIVRSSDGRPLFTTVNDTTENSHNSWHYLVLTQIVSHNVVQQWASEYMCIHSQLNRAHHERKQQAIHQFSSKLLQTD